ncbi:hypothetical protein [Pseudoalteromonas rubra]|uniref:hypothetical protein n=1 Tax=Pseudoalteromonas rubra TaxID=43658 RepID=UPI000F7A0F27|nr:hypothetical protein [Pseudoalteromonas rubra]
MNAYVNSYVGRSLQKQKEVFNNSLILNPTENIPLTPGFMGKYEFMSGMYVTDIDRDNLDKSDLKVAFAGRGRASHDNRIINEQWSQALKASACSLRLLSGLHAHIAVFMSLGAIGETVLLLPEHAGGHFSTHRILDRLGFKIIDIPTDDTLMKVDTEKTKAILKTESIDYLFIDRSEGLVYEDFTEIVTTAKKRKVSCIYDASQYLSQIITGYYKSPFDMGFDIILGSLHKNFPGPQKAFVASKHRDENWERLSHELSIYVSNSHPLSIYQAGNTLECMERLSWYAEEMIKLKVKLEGSLEKSGLPIINSPQGSVPSHHIWLRQNCANNCYSFFKVLEKIRIHVNFRQLPYNLGPGLRLGTSAAVQQGLRLDSIDALSDIIKRAYQDGFSLKLKQKTRLFINEIKFRNDGF